MSSNTAQEEADKYFSPKEHSSSHPEDQVEDDVSDRSSEKERPIPTYVVDDADGSDEDTLHNNGKMSTTTTATYSLPHTLFDANTGPKGVIADAASFERAKKKSFRRTLYNLTASVYPFSSSTQSQKDTLSSSPEGSARGSASEPDNDEEEFMRKWRESRLRELSVGSAHQRRASPSKRKYGSFDAVDANGYLDAVEKVPVDTMVVVCIYDPESSVSTRVESSLSTLARRYATTRFVKLHHEIAEMDHVGSPAILAYKGGDVFATMVDLKANQRDVDGLESLLKENRVITE